MPKNIKCSQCKYLQEFKEKMFGVVESFFPFLFGVKQIEALSLIKIPYNNSEIVLFLKVEQKLLMKKLKETLSKN